MAMWLLKTEPSSYSFADLERDKRTVWDGVKNPQALKNLALIEPGDDIVVYHTGDEKALIGVATALGAAYPDPKKNDAKLLVFEVAVKERLPRPVTLAEIKASSAFDGWELVRLPRLSVMPISPAHWANILALTRQ